MNIPGAACTSSPGPATLPFLKMPKEFNRIVGGFDSPFLYSTDQMHRCDRIDRNR